MPPPRDGERADQRIERFTRAERYVHWTTTALMLALIATGAILYNDQLAIYTGHRSTAPAARASR